MKLRKSIFVLLVLVSTLLVSFQDRFFEIAKQIEIYNNVFKTLNLNYIDEINPGDLTNKAINNTLANLDPYTRFYNEQQVEDATIRRNGEYAGIGISSWYTKKGIVIINIKEGYPAHKAGLKAGDLITSVNDESLKNMERTLLSQVLKGVPNTDIKIKIKRGSKNIDFKLKLDKIKVNPVPFYEMIDKESGYIKLNSFTNGKATKEVRKAFVELEKKGMKKLVFDLRHNPGGSLYDAVNITNLFIEKGKTVVITKGKRKKNSTTYKTKNLPLNLEIPVVVLIDSRSASASEIVSGSLQDYDRAVVMGERSYGKGLVQRYFKLNYGTQMKATISKYYTPSGRCIQEIDYANRDLKTGKIPKFSEGKVNTFKTTNGRTVFDGGGVTPDVKLNRPQITEETKNLLNSRSIFNFVTNYTIANPKVDIQNFKFSKKDFASFKNYLVETDTLFNSKEESLFRKAYLSLKNPKLVDSEYKKLRKKLKEESVKKISVNYDLISEMITNAIVEQFTYEKGRYQYQLKNDVTIKKAVTLLNNTKKYKAILKGSK